MTRDGLERELRALAAEVEWPPTPDLALAVAARLGEPAPRGGFTIRLRRPLAASPLALAAIVVVALLLAAALVPPARSVILRVLGVTRGARIVRVEPPPPGATHGPLDLGRPLPLARARRRVAFAVRLPAVLGPPALTRYSARIAGGAITLSWPGYVLTEFQGQGVPFFQKLVGPRTRVRRARVGAAAAFFLSGAPHELVFADRYGQPLAGPRALVRGNVLLWDAGELSLRLETRRGLPEALAVARSIPLR
jgi:hypothetical protein